MPDWLRDIVEEARFQQDIDALARVYERMASVHQAITWSLARDARLGTSLRTAPDFRVFESEAIGTTPAFWILYTFDANTVYLHSIEEVKDDGESD